MRPGGGSENGWAAVDEGWSGEIAVDGDGNGTTIEKGRRKGGMPFGGCGREMMGGGDGTHWVKTEQEEDEVDEGGARLRVI